MLKRILAGAGIIIAIILAFKYCEFKKEDYLLAVDWTAEKIDLD